MYNNKASYMAVYGKGERAVKMPKTWCEECDGYTLVVKGIKLCCEKPAKCKPEFHRQEIF